MEQLSRRLHHIGKNPPVESRGIFLYHHSQLHCGSRAMTYRTVNVLAPVDAAYLAGLIDGEGTVTLSRRHRTDQRQLVVSIANTERPLLEWTLLTVGAGKITGKRVTSPKHTPSFTYSITNRQALHLLGQIVPYLKSYKIRRTRLVLEHYVRLTPRNGRYTDAIRECRERFLTSVMAIGPQSPTTCNPVRVIPG
jgi:hypothetical protein